MTTGPLSPNLRVQWSHALADGTMQAREYQDLQKAYRQENPAASDADIDKQMLDVLGDGQDTSSPHMQELMARLKAGRAVTTQEFSPVAGMLDFRVEVAGAEIQDIDGAGVQSRHDLKGHVDSLNLDLRLNPDSLSTSARQITTDFLRDYDIPIVFGSWEDGLKAKAQEFIDRSSVGLRTVDVDGQNHLGVDLNIDGQHAVSLLQVGSDDKGRLVINPLPDHVALKHDWSRILNTDMFDHLTRQMVDKVFDTLKENGIPSDLTFDGQRFIIEPKEVVLKGEQIAKLLGPEQAARYGKAELHLKPEQIRLEADGTGIKVKLTGVDIDGSSNVDGPEAQPTDRPDQVRLDSATVYGGIDNQGETKRLSVSDITGSVSASGELDGEALARLREGINATLAQVDARLQAYGLSRQQLEKILASVPQNLFQDLLKSGNKGDIAEAAKTFGVDGSQLNQVLAFLKEEPAQRLLQDVSSLTKLLEDGTRVQGQGHFSLEHLELSGSDKGFLGQLQGLKLDLDLSTKTPAGVESQTHLDATVADASIMGTPTATPTVRVGPSEVKTSTEISDNPAGGEPLPRVQQFLAGLGDKSSPLIKADGYLQDEGPGRLRKGKGLSAATARDMLAQLGPEQLLALRPADAKARAEVAKALKADPKLLDYLVNYVDKYVLSGPAQTSHLDTRTTLGGAALDAHGTTLLKPEVWAKLDTGNQTFGSDLELSTQADSIRTDVNGTATVTGLSVSGTGEVRTGQNQPTQASLLFSAQDFASTPAGFTFDNARLDAGLDSVADARVAAAFSRISGDQNALQANGTISNFSFVDGQTRFDASSPGFQAVSSDGSLDLDASARWKFSTAGDGATTKLSGTTQVEIDANRLASTRTDALGGSMTVKTDQLLEIVGNRPGMKTFIDQLRRDGVLRNKELTVKLTQGTVTTNAKGQASYDLKVETPGIQTRYGDGSLSFRADAKGLTGRLKFTPNQVAEAAVRDLLRDITGSDVTGVKFRQGEMEVGIDHFLVKNTHLKVNPQGDKVEITVDGAKLIGLFESNGLATDKVKAALAKYGATQTGQYTLQIPLANLAAGLLGPDLTGNVHLSADIRGDKELNLDFNYPAQR